MKIRKGISAVISTAFALLLTLAASTEAGAQGRYANQYSRADVDNIIRRMEENSDEFRTDFRNELNDSGLNSSTRNRYNGYVASMENAIDDLRRYFDRNDSWWESRSRVQTVVARSQDTNTMMRSLPFRRQLERQWNQLRNQINRVADTYDLSGLDGGGWQGGGGGGGGGAINPPNWAEGTFYGTAPDGSRITLTISRNGSVTANINGGLSYGSYTRNNVLHIGGATSRVSRLSNGIQTTRTDNGERINYSREGGGWNPGNPGNQINPPSWATGRFYGTAPDGTRIILTINGNGSVTANIGGSTSYGSFTQGNLLNMNGATANVTRRGNGIRTTRTDNGEVINYSR